MDQNEISGECPRFIRLELGRTFYSPYALDLDTSALAQNSKTYFKIIATAGRARHGI